MPFLQALVNCDEGLEGLYFVGEDGLDLHALPEAGGGLVVPGVDDAGADMFSLWSRLFDAGGFADVYGELGLLPVSGGGVLIWKL